MSNGPIPVNGGALPKIDRQLVMRRAWIIFRETYHYPQIKFASIGRPCFASCLRAAWAEYRQTRSVAAVPVKERRERIKVLRHQIELAQYADNYETTQRIEAACLAEIATLAGTMEARSP